MEMPYIIAKNASVFMLMKSRTWKAGLRQQNYSGKHFNAN